MKRGSQSFQKSERLRRRDQFLELGKCGKKTHSQNTLIIWKRTESPGRWLGITASKRTGNAVKRNAIKRWVRETFRKNKQLLPSGTELIVIAKRHAFQKGKTELEGELKKSFRVIAKAQKIMEKKR